MNPKNYLSLVYGSRELKKSGIKIQWAIKVWYMDSRNLNKSGYGSNELIKSGSGSKDNYKSKPGSKKL